jgi:hypothetical protein
MGVRYFVVGAAGKTAQTEYDLKPHISKGNMYLSGLSDNGIHTVSCQVCYTPPPHPP